MLAVSRRVDKVSYRITTTFSRSGNSSHHSWCLAGIDNEFLFTGRLDNLGMRYCCLAALLDSYPTEGHLADESAVKAIALFDHEEVGSASAQGMQQSVNASAQ